MAQTFLQTLGFQDPDLQNPKHDEIIIWLTEEVKTHAVALSFEWYMGLDARKHYVVDNKEKLLKEFKTFPSKVTEKIMSMTDDQLKTFFDSRPVVDFRVAKVELEKPIVKQGNYIVGFADLIVYVQKMMPEPYIDLSLDDKDAVNFLWRYWNESISFIYEVKTQISSLGELLRQLNTYKAYYPAEKIVVVAPKTPLQKIIEDQGYAFLEYTK